MRLSVRTTTNVGPVAIVAVLLAFAAPNASAAEATSVQNNPSHSGNADEPSLTPPLGKKWERKLAVSQALILPGRVIVGVERFDSNIGDPRVVELRALDPGSGADLWRRPVEARQGSSLAADSGRIYLLDVNEAVHAYDARDGRELWVRSAPGQFEGFDSSPVAAGGLVYVTGPGTATFPLTTSQRNAAYALRAADGSTQWQAGVSDGFSVSGSVVPALDGQRVVVATEEGAVALDRFTGVRRWSAQGEDDRQLLRGATPQIHGGRVYLGTGTVLDANTGARVGTYTPSAPAAFDGTLGFAAFEEVFTATDLASGVTRWSRRSGFSTQTAPLVTGGAVYSLHDNYLFGRDRATGRTLWRSYLIDAEFSSSTSGVATAAGQGRLIVTSGVGVVAFGAGPTTRGLSLLPIRPRDGEIEAEPSKRTVIFGEGVRISGRMRTSSSGTGTGDPAVLQADRFPFEGRWRNVRRKKITGLGFTFVDRPERNTRYRVRNAAYARFATKPFVVRSGFGTLVRPRLRGRSLTTKITIVHSPRQRLPGRRVFVYVDRRGSRPVLRQSRRLRRVRRGLVRAVTRFRVPPVRPGDRVITCLRERRNDGYGKPLAVERVCGRRIL